MKWIIIETLSTKSIITHFNGSDWRFLISALGKTFTWNRRNCDFSSYRSIDCVLSVHKKSRWLLARHKSSANSAGTSHRTTTSFRVNDTESYDYFSVPTIIKTWLLRATTFKLLRIERRKRQWRAWSRLSFGNWEFVDCLWAETSKWSKEKIKNSDKFLNVTKLVELSNLQCRFIFLLKFHQKIHFSFQFSKNNKFFALRLKAF